MFSLICSNYLESFYFILFLVFFFNDTATTEIYTLSLHDALPISPGRDGDLSHVRAVGSTGAPLPPEGFTWIVDALGRPIQVGSVSGGTDVCTAFLQSCPLLPVRAGELQCAALGAKVEAYSVEGKPVVGGVGELVITRPLPSMPVYLWNDADGARYRASYFDVFPGVWRHGD